MGNQLSSRPSITPAQALALAERRFGISVDSAHPLPSDRDQNLLLVHEASSRKYVMKLSHAGEDPKVLDFQNRMLEHLNRAGFPTANVLRDTEGKTIFSMPGDDGQTFLTRILSWVPGTQLYRVRPQTPALLRSLGSFLGGMDRALEDFSHPAQDRDLKWDLKQAGRVVRSHRQFLDDPWRADLLETLSGRFLERLGPLVPDLRLGVIHADANDHNVLVGKPGPDGARLVSGIVDFGDAARSYIAGEVAIASAYVMLEKGDPVGAACDVVTGYHQAFPLSETEIEALFPLMGLRLCASVAIAAQQKKAEPGNEYLTVTEDPAWDLLRTLADEVPDFPALRFREACGLSPVPNAEPVVDWLRNHGREGSPVVAAVQSTGPRRELLPLSLTDVPLHIFDLRGDTAEFPQTPDTADAKGWTRLLFEKLASVDATVGIGRYDEVRRWYTADAFATSWGDPPEWRTVHLGIDVFLPAGTPVLAPFNAVVHSVANNDSALDYGPAVILEHQIPEEEGGPLVFWTLYGHLGPEALADLSAGQEVAKGERFATIGDYPGNGNWSPHLHFQIITDCLGYQGTFPGVGLPSQRPIWKALSPDPNLILGIPEAEELGSHRAAPGRPSGAPLNFTGGRSKEAILQSRRDHLGPTLSIAYARPLKIVRGQGQYLIDDEGQAFLDCVNNVPHVGHNHPRVVKAGQDQMALLNTNTRYLHDGLVEYAERLVATLPDPLSVVYFVCTGSEANELALRMARTHTGRHDVIVVGGAYHGNTSALVDLSPYKFDRAGGQGAPDWVHQTLLPDPYRGRFRATAGEESEAEAPPAGDDDPAPEYLPLDELGERYAAHVRDVIEAMAGDGREPAAFFCESLLGCGGQIVLPDGYMAKAFEHLRVAGGVCIADEVQVGFGRVGTHFWAFETQDVIPDIVTLGKPMANGHPMAAVVTTREIAESFTTGMEYFNTFGGNPVSCAIGMAVLDVIEDEGLQENARVVGAHLLGRLREMAARHPVVGDVRGLGLYLGVELVEDRETREPAPLRASRAKERLRDHRLLLSTDGPEDNVLKIKPPIVFTRENADRLVRVLDRVLEEDGIRL